MGVRRSTAQKDLFSFEPPVLFFLRRNLTSKSLAAPSDQELTAAQIIIMKQAASKVKDTVQRLASDHRDLHSTVSKVGKAIDRVREQTITLFIKA